MINKHNQLLLNKLVEIQAGRQTSVVPAPKRLRKMQKHNASIPRNLSISNLSPPMSYRNRNRGSLGPGSLNHIQRLKEQERIEKENHKFAQRLYQSKGVLNKKSLDEGYDQQTKYKNNISKVQPGKDNFFGDLSTMSKTNRLPPLNANYSNSTSQYDLKSNKRSASNNSRKKVQDGVYFNPEEGQNSHINIIARPIAAQEQTEKS